ncbi:MAG TPA: hypothetical protein VIJ25_05670, partial [Methylococcales bacterium]
DTFTEVEAYSLMASGYLMTKHQLHELNKMHRDLHPKNGTWADFDIDAPGQNWLFSPIIPILAADPNGSDRKARDLEKQLRASKMLFGKVWVLIPALKLGGPALVLAILALLGYELYVNWQDQSTITLGAGSIAIAIFIIFLGVLLPFGKYIPALDTLKKWLSLSILTTIGCIAANLHLKFFDKWFKERGKLDRLLKLPDTKV